MDKVELHDARYLMHIQGGGDTWMLSGRVFGHPNFKEGHHVQVSTPLAYNKETRELKVASGREYQIFSFAAPEEEVVAQIEKDIERGAYEGY